MIRSACCIVLFFCFLHSSQAQTTANDFGNTNKALGNLRAAYMRAMDAGAGLYIGRSYERYWNGIQGHPFFLSDLFDTGRVVYDGVLYEKVPLLYDMTHDELVTRDHTGRLYVSFLQERVSAFSIGTHDFVRIYGDSTSGTSMPTGFYEKLYDDGKTRALVRRKNEIVRVMKTEETYGLAGAGSNRFMEFDFYYIEKQGQYYAIHGESDLQAVFRDRRQEVRKFLNGKNVRYKKDPAGVIAQTARYYASLHP